MRLELSFTDYTNDDTGATVEHRNVRLMRKDGGRLQVIDWDNPGVAFVYDLTKIGDLRLSVHED